MRHKTALFFVSLTLGLAWAIRGHFGHEHGAAWAGAVAAMAVITVARRRDWAGRLPVLAALAGIGWGAGGMMSYGIVVGYGRGVDFGNVFYGLAMLAVVGALYGFIGGGFFALGLASTEESRPQWASLLSEMVAGGLLAWWLIIAQFGWMMTPPRSELWAACLGAAVAMAWFLQRNGFEKALRVAGYTALGAGFGFGFGNFLQTLGTASGITFNWWNVMEFTLGFFGGLGMSYGILTREWPRCVPPSKTANWIGFGFLLLGLPLINLTQAMRIEKFVEAAERIGIADGPAFAGQQVAIAYLVTIIFFSIALFVQKRASERPEALVSLYTPTIFFLYLLCFLTFSFIIKLVFISGQPFQLNQMLYVVIFGMLLITWFLTRSTQAEAFVLSRPESGWRWFLLIGLAVSLLAICSVISITVHEGLPGSHDRFQ